MRCAHASWLGEDHRTICLQKCLCTLHMLRCVYCVQIKAGELTDAALAHRYDTVEWWIWLMVSARKKSTTTTNGYILVRSALCIYLCVCVWTRPEWWIWTMPGSVVFSSSSCFILVSLYIFCFFYFYLFLIFNFKFVDCSSSFVRFVDWEMDKMQFLVSCCARAAMPCLHRHMLCYRQHNILAYIVKRTRV